MVNGLISKEKMIEDAYRVSPAFRLMYDEIKNMNGKFDDLKSDVEYIRSRVDLINEKCARAERDASIARTMIENHIEAHWKLPLSVGAVVGIVTSVLHFIMR